MGTPDEWRSDEHPLRLDMPYCSVTYVPTLVHWMEEGAGSRLTYVLSSDETQEDVRLALAKFLKETAAGRR